MAHIDISAFDRAAVSGAAFVDGAVLMELGMRAALGRDGAVDLVAAHMYFNLADRKGIDGAASQRQDVAGEMSKAEIARALRAAREWLTLH
ncbi:hypothetical protein E3C22_09495 [Jiella endophytica]|uniref:Sel1 repeat family protein n=1 Tax=Jiella endophytica TaxID=2558362 RepID=A0A4Y8RS78_9HYPH|nr:hypothetical protein [Jiella endophytica]TFF25567.1 hypothetical protein E3C22_09495 [Jiella endophytica]